MNLRSIKYVRNSFALIFFLCLHLSSSCVIAATFNQAEAEKFKKSFSFEKEFSYADMKESMDSDKLESLEDLTESYKLVYNLIKEKKFAQAKRRIKSFIEKYPKEPYFYNLNAILELADEGKSDAVEKNFLKALELDEKNLQANLGLANLALKNMQFDKATRYANKGLRINPFGLNAYKILVDVALRQIGVDAAEVVLLDTYKKFKDNLKAEIEILNYLRKIYEIKQQPEKQLVLVEELAQRNYFDMSVKLLLASAQLANNDSISAEKTLRQIVAKEPNNPKHLFNLARLVSEIGGKDVEVLSLLDKAAQNLKNPSFVFTFKTAFLIKRKRYKEALSVANHVDQLNPRLSAGKILKADVYLAEKKYDKALRNYQLAYQVAPTQRLVDAMIKVLTIQEKHKEVVVLLEKELKKNKDNELVEFKLAATYQKLGQFNMAIKYYESLLSKNKDSIVIINNLAWAYTENKDLKGLDLAKKAYAKTPKLSMVVDTYGYILFKSGYKQEGLKILKEASLLDPNQAEIQLHLAEVLIATNNKKNANRILQKLLNEVGVEKATVKELLQSL